MTSTLQESTEQIHIDSVFKRRSKPSDNTTSMANVLNQQMSQLFHDPRNFIYELLQNAEDANASSIVFTIMNKTLVVSYNGDAFTPHDIERICDVSRDNDPHAAAKSNQEEKIGYKGIGFKSVFGISKEISILSPETNYFFRFSKSHRGKESHFLSESDPMVRFPWQIIPIWIEERDRTPFASASTEKQVTIVLEDVDLAKIRPELFELLSQSEILVFLNKIQSISYVEEDRLFTIKKQAMHDDLMTIEQRSPRGITETLWKGYHADIPIEHDITTAMQDMDLSACPAKMKSAKFMKISFAAPVANHAGTYTFMPVTDGKLFCHLPTAVQCKLPFLINAKFTLNQDRSMLISDVRNQFLLEKIAIEQFKWFAQLAQDPWYRKDVLRLLNKQDVADIFPQLKRKEQQEEDESVNSAADLLSAYHHGFRRGFREVAFVLSKRDDLLCLSDCVVDTTGFFEDIDERLLDDQLTAGGRSRIVAYDLVDRDRLIRFSTEYTETTLLDNIPHYMETVVGGAHSAIRSRIVHFILHSQNSRSFLAKKILINTRGALCIPAESFMASSYALPDEVLAMFALDIIALELYDGDVIALLSSFVAPLTLDMLIRKHVTKMIKENQITHHNSVRILQFIYNAALADPSILPILRGSSEGVAFSRFKVITRDGQLRELKNCFFPLTAGDTNTCHEFQLAVAYGIVPNNQVSWGTFLACFGIATSAKLSAEDAEYADIYNYFNLYIQGAGSLIEEYTQYIIENISTTDIPASARSGKKVAEVMQSIRFENFLSFPFLFLSQNPATLNLFYQALNEQQELITQKPKIQRKLRSTYGGTIEVREHFLSYYFRQNVLIQVCGKNKKKTSVDLFYLPQLLDCFDPRDLPINLAEVPIPLTEATADFLGFKRAISLQQGLSLLTSLNRGRDPSTCDHNYFLRLRAIYHLIIQIDLAKEDVSIIQPWKQQNGLLSRKKTFVLAQDLKVFDELAMNANPKSGNWLHDAGLESHEFKKLAFILRIPCHSEDDNFTPVISEDETKLEDMKRLKSYILESLPLMVLNEYLELSRDTVSLHQTLFEELYVLDFIYCESIHFADAKHQAYVRIKETSLYVVGRAGAVIADALGKKFFKSESTRREFKVILQAFSTQEKNSDFLRKRLADLRPNLKSKYDEMTAYQIARMSESRPVRKLELTETELSASATPVNSLERTCPERRLFSPESTKQENRQSSAGAGLHTFFFDPSNSPVTHAPSHCKKDRSLAAMGNRPSVPGSHKKASATLTPEEEGAIAETEIRNKHIGDRGEKCVFQKITYLLSNQLRVESTDLMISMKMHEDSSETILVPSARFVKDDNCIDVIWFNKDRIEGDIHESPVDMVIMVNGEQRYFIEIKSTATAQNPIFFLTTNEWQYMREKNRKSILVRAYDVENASTRFEVYQDPFGMIVKDLITFMTGGKFRLKIKTAEEAKEHLFTEDSEIGCRLS